jgi:hypothetical protein
MRIDAADQRASHIAGATQRHRCQDHIDEPAMDKKLVPAVDTLWAAKYGRACIGFLILLSDLNQTVGKSFSGCVRVGLHPIRHLPYPSHHFR